MQPRADELDRVVALIAGQQRRPDRDIVYVGNDESGIRAELDALTPSWGETVRVARGDGGAIVGAAVVEWDAEVGRAWVLGPWVDGDDEAWARWARPLVDEVTAQVPPDIVDRELGGAVANVRLAALAEELGWPASETNYAYVVDGTTAASWPSGGDPGVRVAVPDDVPAIQPWHDAEFPASYATASQLLERAARGEQIVLVAEDGGSVVGYAAGKVQPDGTGYIDFVAVDPAARGGGVGRRLVMALAGQLLASTAEVALTVQEHRAPARALYDALGFRVDAAFRGYRSRPG